VEIVTTDLLMLLAQRLGERLDTPLRLYLLGGSAMLLWSCPGLVDGWQLGISRYPPWDSNPEPTD